MKPPARALSDNTMDDPVFMLGCPRSGTTLLASHLGRHREILALPETHFFPGSYGGNALARALAHRHHATLIHKIWTRNPRIRDLPLNVCALRADFIARGIRDPRDALDLIFSHALEGTGKSRVVEKTPRHIEHIDRILRWYPRAKILCVTRDGRDVVNSLINAPWTHSDPDRHTALWRWSTRISLDSAARHPDRVRVVRYETFVADPVTSLREICTFLGVPYDAAMLDSSIQTCTAPEWEIIWKAAATREVDTSALFKWKRHANQGLMAYREGIMRDELAALALPLRTGTPSRRPPIRWSLPVFRVTHALQRALRTHVRQKSGTFRKQMTTRAEGADVPCPPCLPRGKETPP